MEKSIDERHHKEFKRQRSSALTMKRNTKMSLIKEEEEVKFFEEDLAN